MLHSINLPHQFIKIILSCISTSELVILLNGQATPSFKPTRGVRQDDSLSPYLFILGMEFLSMLINQQVSIGSWQPTPVTSKGSNMSHTLFADDVFLFAEATHQNATTTLMSFKTLPHTVVSRSTATSPKFSFPKTVLLNLSRISLALSNT